MDPRPTKAPAPIHDRPHPDACPVWIVDRDGWSPAWALPVVGGLAVRFAHDGKRWTLEIQHETSGLRVIGARQGGSQRIDYTAANLRAVRRLITDLLSLTDWTKPDFRTEPDLADRARPIHERHLPAIPEWRAWRLDPSKVGDMKAWRADRRWDLDCKWFKTLAAAQKWAGHLRGWWATERYDVPPAYGRDRQPDFVAMARGDSFPDGCTSFLWSAWGSLRTAKPSEPAATLEPRTDDDFKALQHVAFEAVDDIGRLPTGEIDESAAALVDRGWLRIVRIERGRHPPIDWFVPTRAGLLALSRMWLSGERHGLGGRIGATSTETTRNAFEIWQSLRRDHGLTRPWDLGGAQARRQRLDAWLTLLGCIARDRRAAAEGQPRIELRRDYDGGSFEIKELAGDVAVAKATRRGSWRWLTFRTCPIVHWAPGSALTATREIDANGDAGSTLREYDYRENAESYAAELRAGRRL